MMRSGWWRVASWNGVPIRLHWTLPIGAFLLGGLKFRPLFWLGFVVVVFVHELGHAYWVRRFGHKVHQVDIAGFGGACLWSGNASPAERSMIAWGGVLAQLVLLAFSIVLIAIFGLGFLQTQLGQAWTFTNLFLMVLNLIPVRPFDGADAWKLFSAVKREGWPAPVKRPSKRRARRVRKPAVDVDAPAKVMKTRKRKAKRRSASERPSQEPSERPSQSDSNGGGGAGAAGGTGGRTKRDEQLELAETFKRLAEAARRAKDDK